MLGETDADIVYLFNFLILIKTLSVCLMLTMFDLFDTDIICFFSETHTYIVYLFVQHWKFHCFFDTDIVCLVDSDIVCLFNNGTGLFIRLTVTLTCFICLFSSDADIVCLFFFYNWHCLFVETVTDIVYYLFY